MEPDESEDRAADRSGRSLVVAFGVGVAIVVVVLVIRRWRRGVAGLAEAGVVGLTDAVIDELLAAS
jgi:hypothetical protein